MRKLDIPRFRDLGIGAESSPVADDGAGDSVDTPEFRERLKDIVFAVANKFDIDCETRDLIAHIDAWAARRAAGTPAPDAQSDPDPIEDLVDTLDLGAQQEGESAAPKDQP